MPRRTGPSSFGEWMIGTNINSILGHNKTPGGGGKASHRRRRGIVRVEVYTDDESGRDSVRVTYPRTSSRSPAAAGRRPEQRRRRRDRDGNDIASAEEEEEEASAADPTPTLAKPTTEEPAAAPDTPKKVRFQEQTDAPKSAMKKTKKTTTETTTQTVVTESESESEPECSVTEQSGSESASENAPPSSSERGRSTDEDAPGETTTDSSGGRETLKDSSFSLPVLEMKKIPSPIKKREEKKKKIIDMKHSRSKYRKNEETESDSDSDTTTTTDDDDDDEPHPTCKCPKCTRGRRKMRKAEEAAKKKSHKKRHGSSSNDHRNNHSRKKDKKKTKKKKKEEEEEGEEEREEEKRTTDSNAEQQQKLKADVPIPDKKANSYPSALPGPHPRRPNYIEPIRAEVVQTERVIETPEDPSPNAYYDARNNIVRVYHGPVWGRSSSASNAGQFQSLYPRRDTSLRPLPMGVPHPMQNPYHHGFARPLSDGWDYAWQQQQHPMYYPPMENEAYLAPPHGAAAAATAPSPEPATNKGAFGVDAAVDDGMPRGYKIGKDNPYLLPKKSIFANRSPSSRSPRDMNDTAGAGTTVGGDSHGGPGQDGWGDAKSNRGPGSGWVDDDNIRQAGSGGWGDVNDDDNNNNNDQAGWADTNNDSNANQTGWGDANIDDDANDDDSNDPGNTWGSSTPAAVATDDDVHHMPGSWCDPTAAVATGGQVDAAVW